MSLDDIKRGKRKTRLDAAENAMLHLNTEVDTNVPPMRPRRLAQMPVRERQSPVADVHHVPAPQEAEQQRALVSDRVLPSIPPSQAPPDQRALEEGRASTLPPLESRDVAERERAETAAAILATPEEVGRLRGMRGEPVTEDYIKELQDAEIAAEAMRVQPQVREKDVREIVPPKMIAYMKLRPSEETAEKFGELYTKRKVAEQTGDAESMREYAKAEKEFMTKQPNLTSRGIESLMTSYARAEETREALEKKEPTEIEKLEIAADVLEIQPTKRVKESVEQEEKAEKTSFEKAKKMDKKLKDTSAEEPGVVDKLKHSLGDILKEEEGAPSQAEEQARIDKMREEAKGKEKIKTTKKKSGRPAKGKARKPKKSKKKKLRAKPAAWSLAQAGERMGLK